MCEHTQPKPSLQLFPLSGAKAVLNNRSYEGTVEFQLAESEDTNPRDQSRCRSGYIDGKLPQMAFTTMGKVQENSHRKGVERPSPILLIFCTTDPMIPSWLGIMEIGLQYIKRTTLGRIHDRIITPALFFSCMVCSESSKNLLSGSKEEHFSEFTKQAGGEWHRVQGSFLAVNLTCMSSACPKSPKGLSPCAHLADGTADLILVHKCSVFSFLQHLNRHTNCSDQFDLPFVSVYRVRAVRFTSPKEEDWEGGQEAAQEQNILCGGICQGQPLVSCWTCDGETLNYTDITIRVHGSLIHLFARGIEQQPSTS
uniref:Ceramide kinase C-terminal domain-containing protein n=1 Tax=Pseudonaja textilis TaxID=8673 RepID=A0A670YB74_PSETE